jgi:hypothetical protein
MKRLFFDENNWHFQVLVSSTCIPSHSIGPERFYSKNVNLYFTTFLDDIVKAPLHNFTIKGVTFRALCLRLLIAWRTIIVLGDFKFFVWMKQESTLLMNSNKIFKKTNHPCAYSSSYCTKERDWWKTQQNSQWQGKHYAHVYWAWTVTYLYNLTMSSAIEISPFEQHFEQKPYIGHDNTFWLYMLCQDTKMIQRTVPGGKKLC